MDLSVGTVSAEKVAAGRERILAELRKVIVGQDEVVDQVLIAGSVPATLPEAAPAAAPEPTPRAATPVAACAPRSTASCGAWAGPSARELRDRRPGAITP